MAKNNARLIEISFCKDGKELEVYVNGWYLCNVIKKELSDEAREELGL